MIRLTAPMLNFSVALFCDYMLYTELYIPFLRDFIIYSILLHQKCPLDYTLIKISVFIRTRPFSFLVQRLQFLTHMKSSYCPVLALKKHLPYLVHPVGEPGKQPSAAIPKLLCHYPNLSSTTEGAWKPTGTLLMKNPAFD